MRFLPAKEWLRRYGRPQFGADLLAGVTLAAYLLPAAIGDSSLARVTQVIDKQVTVIRSRHHVACVGRQH